ncbi:LlaJI family restriction endonuclease [Peribacillus glennii]|nr:LlaJI family restriction endonuclease [Peribacillus glennii]
MISMNNNNKDIRQHCFIENYPYSYAVYQDSVYEELFQMGYCEKKMNGNFIFKCTGFIFLNNTFFIIFPKGYRLPDDNKELIDHIRVLVSTLIRYKRENKLVEEENELNSSAGEIENSVAAALWLLQDYKENNFIRRNVKKKRINHGNKINWPLTIKKVNPTISNSRPVYLNFVTEKSFEDSEHILYALHRYVVQKSFQKYGWLVDVLIEVDPFFDELPVNQQLALFVLQRELQNTFLEREIRLLNYIIEFISGSGENNNEKTFYTLITSYFHHVWEVICSYVFKSEYLQLKDNIPQPVWHIKGTTKTPRQIPDILFLEQDTLYVLDAKYYDVANNLPGWHDLVKQFFYAVSLKTVYQKVVNVLIFPGSTGDKQFYHGYVDIDSRIELGSIQAYSIDTYTAMSLYSAYRTSDFRESLVRNIDLC